MALFNYPDDMDREIVPICDFLNTFPSVITRYSCSGHGDCPFYILMIVGNIASLKKINHIFNLIERINNEIKVEVSIVSDYLNKDGKNEFKLWGTKTEDLLRIRDDFITVIVTIKSKKTGKKSLLKEEHFNFIRDFFVYKEWNNVRNT